MAEAEQQQQQQTWTGKPVCKGIELQLRDFLLVYNRMTELCFQRCVSNLNYRTLAVEEESCLEGCAGKLVRSNHRLMAAYVRLMPTLVQRRLADYEASQTGPENSPQPPDQAS
ncbi:mitochondrial import inner membrane translocase subunit Tim10 B [Sceloporus undulatus]|uniref:mitochondrial import inner membrane translocase subunit Tim10 B n=1 Tax=Sceloporus undulatus TaxID=8520 RepID=UPI001C4AF6BF|nr:mitochondrial import inner membrane translocase subunit Tim10 B [Sceloporus undulatus]